MLCESVFRALLGQARAEGAARIDPPALGRVLGLDRAPEVKTIRRKIRLLAEAGRAGDSDRRDGPPPHPGPPRTDRGALRRRARARLPGHPRDRENPCAQVEVPRPGHGGNLGVRRRGGSAAGGDGRTGRLAGVGAAPVDPRPAHRRRRRSPRAGRVRPRRLVPDPVRRPGRGRVRHPDLAQRCRHRHRRGTVHRVRPHRRTRPHPHLATADTEVALDIAEGPRKGEVFAMRRSACSMPPQPARCTS